MPQAPWRRLLTESNSSCNGAGSRVHIARNLLASCWQSIAVTKPGRLISAVKRRQSHLPINCIVSPVSCIGLKQQLTKNTQHYCLPEFPYRFRSYPPDLNFFSFFSLFFLSRVSMMQRYWYDFCLYVCLSVCLSVCPSRCCTRMHISSNFFHLLPSF